MAQIEKEKEIKAKPLAGKKQKYYSIVYYICEVTSHISIQLQTQSKKTILGRELFKIGAQIKVTARRIIFKLSSSFMEKELYLKMVMKRLC
ncbi:MAG: hypothetical protein PF689_07025 [Deltaproteobacteria bacterium]|jgi:hypothetical protein|nr:hypothetical protein [Deltaproteobacteria bacterium]